MAGATGIPALSGNTLDGGGQPPSASLMNSQRIVYAARSLVMILDSGHESHYFDLFHRLCLELARGIDCAVANNDVPSKAQELPILLKKVCLHKNDVLQTSIMVLMISVKIACKFEWFSNKDTEELLTLAKEIGSRFCSPGDINSEPCQSIPIVLKVMARFCPQMKTGQIFASLEVNPGYGAYLVDFHISKSEVFSLKETIWLFVAQTDNIETSSCVIRPPQVNFLLNGWGVTQKRTNDNILVTGPQFPTDVTLLCILGANLLQVVGQFNGHYLIVIASMSVTSTLETPVLQDYVLPEVAAHDSDPEIIEGPSRIPLNCPISGKRIKTPVKGHSCKHLQCFDLDNYVKINMINPFWRCPCCNQTISYLDIRTDQYMVKVLKDVGDTAAYVTIFEDGSWKGGSESNDHVGQPSGKTFSCQQNGSEPQEPSSCSDSLAMVFDLTNGNDEMDLTSTCEIEDRKPSQANPQVHSIATTLPMQSEINNTSANSPNHSVAATIIMQSEMNYTYPILNQASIPQLEDDFWSGFSLPTSARSIAQNVGGIAEPFLASNMTSAVLSDEVSHTLNRGHEELHGNTSSVLHSQFPAHNGLQLQQSQVAHSIMSNEHSVPSIPRHVSRTPIATNVLPVQSPQSVPLQRSWTILNSSPTAEGFNTISSDTQMQQQFSRSFTSPMQVAEMASSSLPHHSMTQRQNRDHQAHLFISSQSVQQGVGLPAPPQLSGPYSQSYRVRTEHQRIPQSVTSPPNVMIRPPPHLQGTHIQQVGTRPWLNTTAGSGNQFIAASQRATRLIQPSQQSPVHIQATRTGVSLLVNSNGSRASVGEQRGNVGGTVQPVTTAEELLDLSSERNWRPTGQMRGSLLGHAYSTALSQFMDRPTQPTQATRPSANPTSLPPVVPPLLQVLLANNRNAHSGQTPNIQ